MKMIIGVDEAGRGPLAGPIALAAFLAPREMRPRLIKILGGQIKDSKQFSPERRREIYKKFLLLRKKGELFFCAAYASNKVIDKKGISQATKHAIKRVFAHIKSRAFDKDCSVRLDGLLKAPNEYKQQKTIVGGDGKDIFIACASIVAKVRRDALMCRLARKYPKYSFEVHKGYGTALHRELIKKLGLSDLHRISFCANIK